MTWKDIVKNSDYEKEEDELNKIIEFMEGALDTLNDIHIGINERYISGQYQGKNARKQYKQDRERAQATKNALVGFIQDLKQLKSLGRSDERDKVKIKRTHEERIKQRKDLFGSE